MREPSRRTLGRPGASLIGGCRRSRPRRIRNRLLAFGVCLCQIEPISRLGTALIAAVVILGSALVAPTADAKVSIVGGEGSKVVDTISKGTCRVSGKKGSHDFFLVAKSDGGKFSLTAFIDAPVFDGFKGPYIAYYGGTDPQIFLRRRADDAVFSNFKLPGTPAGTVGAGGIEFRRDGRRVGVGLDPAVNRGASEGYSFAGVLNCKYLKR